jgi:hypothetical protein
MTQLSSPTSDLSPQLSSTNSDSQPREWWQGWWISAVVIFIVFSLIVCAAVPATAQSPDPDVVPAFDESIPLTGDQVISQPNFGNTDTTIQAIGEKARLDPEILATINLYRAQSELYQTREREFSINKEQYLQLNTLAALEKAVQSTQQVMSARLDVLETYMKLLRLLLLNADGVEITSKEETLLEVEDQLGKLSDHRLQVNTSADRASVALRADEFEELAPSLQETNYQVLSLLAQGKLQVVYDKTASFQNSLKTELLADDNPLVKQQRERAITETEAKMAEAKVGLDKAKGLYNEATVEGKNSRASYNSLNRELGGVYADLTQSLTFIQELIRFL